MSRSTKTMSFFVVVVFHFFFTSGFVVSFLVFFLGLRTFFFFKQKNSLALFPMKSSAPSFTEFSE